MNSPKCGRTQTITSPVNTFTCPAMVPLPSAPIPGRDTRNLSSSRPRHQPLLPLSVFISLKLPSAETGAMAGKQQPPHIVLFPFMAQGHLIPFLSLAKLIHQRHPGRYTVTLVNTPLNIRRLRSSLPQDSPILLRDLPFPGADHGLPPGAENTDSVSYGDLRRLCLASEALQPHFEHLLSDIAKREGRPPVCIIGDFLMGWTAVVARKLGIFHTTFSTCGGFGTAVYFAMWLHLPHLRTDAEEFPVPGLPESFRLHRSQLPLNIRGTEGINLWVSFSRRQISLCLESGGMLCNTVEELEKTGVELLRKVVALPVWAIGPILPKDGRPSDSRTGKRAEMSLRTFVEWLERQPAASVIYVSFGSQNTIGAHQTLQLAAGLEASGHPFIWVIRPPFGFDLNGDFRSDWLPGGFEERMRESGRGVLVRNWAPQVEILAHASTGAFLSHCGWNSVLESLGSGVPLVGWPLAAEQFYNSKMLEEELGVAVELARGPEAEVTSREVEGVVKQVMGSEKGEDMRRRAARCSEMIGAAICDGGEGNKGASVEALDSFLEAASRAAAGEPRDSPSSSLGQDAST